MTKRASWADSPDAVAQALDRVFLELLLSTGVLWGCPNMLFTQHSGGFSPERQIRHMSLLAENVRRYAHGLPLMNVVDKERGY